MVSNSLFSIDCNWKIVHHGFNLKKKINMTARKWSLRSYSQCDVTGWEDTFKWIGRHIRAWEPGFAHWAQLHSPLRGGGHHLLSLKAHWLVTNWSYQVKSAIVGLWGFFFIVFMMLILCERSRVHRVSVTFANWPSCHFPRVKGQWDKPPLPASAPACPLIPLIKEDILFYFIFEAQQNCKHVHVHPSCLRVPVNVLFLH